MKLSLLPLMFALSAGIMAQSRSFDCGNGEMLTLKTGVTVIELIEQNKPSQILKYLASDYHLDIEEFNSTCEMVSKEFASSPTSHPPTFLENKPADGWYERTYYGRKGMGVAYKFQIHLKLATYEDIVWVTEISFRKGSEIEERPDAVAQLDRTNNEVPPPPPPPPAFKDD